MARLIVGLAAALIHGVIGLALWVGVGCRVFANASLLISDWARAQHRHRDGELRCERGHVVPTDGIFQCGRCDYTYDGSAWLCANVECRATTTFTNCPTCGLSVRSPYRWGRP